MCRKKKSIHTIHFGTKINKRHRKITKTTHTVTLIFFLQENHGVQTNSVDFNDQGKLVVHMARMPLFTIAKQQQQTESKLNH